MAGEAAWPAAEAALLLIDWQRGFEDVAAWGRERNNPQAEENAAALLRAWRARGWPVWHVGHASRLAGSPLHPDAPGFDWQDFARPQAGEPEIVKQVNSAFIGTDLEQQLREAGVRQVVASGVTTDSLRQHQRAHGGQSGLSGVAGGGRLLHLRPPRPGWQASACRGGASGAHRLIA